MQDSGLPPLLMSLGDWVPTPVAATLAMAALAGLDLIGALAAKEWSEGHGYRWAVLGVASFVVLFYVYASSLQYAELAVVTMGWIVLLQLGLVVIDWFRFDAHLSPSKLVAIGVILLAQGYVVLGPNG